MKYISVLLVLGFQACISGFTDDKAEEQRSAARKFKDIIAEAKKIANREYARTENGEVGIQKITKDKNKRGKTLLDLIEEYEVKMYARKLENMMKARKRCASWGCFDMKATNATTTATTPPETPPPPPPNTTPKKNKVIRNPWWSWGSWGKRR